MTKVRFIGLLTIFCILASFIAVFSSITMPAIAASEKDNNTYDVNKISYEIFGDVKIESSEYLYNLDESADYIYVNFESNGYAVYLRETLELLEYSPQGDLPYPKTGKKYYCGPNNYLKKDNQQFKNLVTGDSISVSDVDAKENSKRIREHFVNKESKQNRQGFNNKSSDFFEGNEIIDNNRSELTKSNTNNSTEKSSTPDIDTRNLISPEEGATYIRNFQYFIINPTHGLNRSDGIPNTCGAVAGQLLLGYNNYYNDRRIIDNQFLNGDNTTLVQRNKNPNFCENPMSMTSDTIGTRSGITGNDSYFLNVINSIPVNATLGQVRGGLIDLLDARNINYDIDSKNTLGLWSVGTTDIKNEINADRPLIIGMNSSLGGVNHWVVGYGYQTINSTYTNNTDQMGYVVHFGWIQDNTIGNTGNNNVWVNSAWCDSYISLEIDHTHNYNVPVGGQFNEHRCGECGHRTSTPFADNQFIHTPDGSIFQMVGGAPIAISNNFWVNVIGPQPLNNISQETFNALPDYPIDGTYVFDGASIFEFVGGAPLPISSNYWINEIGIQPYIRVDGWSLTRYSGAGSVRRYPADGTYVHDAVSVFEFIGGAPLGISSSYWNLIGPQTCVRADSWSLTRYSGIGCVRQFPADGTYVSSGISKFEFVGGAPLTISSSYFNSLGLQTCVYLDSWSITHYSGAGCVRQYPADGTYVSDGVSIFEFVGGAPLPISYNYWVNEIGIQQCVSVDCWSLTRYSGQGCVRQYPADGTYVSDGVSIFEFVGGAPLGISSVYWNLIGPQPCVRADSWSLTRYSGIGCVNQHPSDNTYIYTVAGNIYYFMSQHAYIDNSWTGYSVLVDIYSLQPYLT